MGLVIVSATPLSHSQVRFFSFGNSPFQCRPPDEIHIVKQKFEHCPWFGVKKSFSSKRAALAFYKESMEEISAVNFRSLRR